VRPEGDGNRGHATDPYSCAVRRADRAKRRADG
jgi:hypothetical protein